MKMTKIWTGNIFISPWPPQNKKVGKGDGLEERRTVPALSLRHRNKRKIG